MLDINKSQIFFHISLDLFIVGFLNAFSTFLPNELSSNTNTLYINTLSSGQSSIIPPLK